MRSLDARRLDPATLLDAAAGVIAAGGVVAFPTDTVYGLLCDPQNAAAVAKVYAMKGRAESKPLILLYASLGEILAMHDAPAFAAIVRRYLPGPLTVVLPRPHYISDRLTSGRPSIGVRVPAHALLQALLARTGPLASTSANRSGAAAYIGQGAFILPQVDLFIDAGPTVQGRESSIVDFTRTPPVILREGAIAKAELSTWLGDPDGV